jgi:anthranilate synthase/aminodeoxychorismate synthase-like glutamine amidotransferase
MFIVIDNYDSFTYNIVQYLGEQGIVIKVFRNDCITLKEIDELSPAALILSPGPGIPMHSGISLSTINYFYRKIPILGIGLGHHCIGQAFGGKIRHASRIMHGKVSKICHDRQGIFNGISGDINAIRYHSLILDSPLPPCLECVAYSNDGKNSPPEIMAIRHKKYPVIGLQFHPESVMTEYGKKIIKNFVKIVRSYRL